MSTPNERRLRQALARLLYEMPWKVWERESVLNAEAVLKDLWPYYAKKRARDLEQWKGGPINYSYDPDYPEDE